MPRHVPTSKLRLFDTASLANLQEAFLQWLLTLLYMLHLASKQNVLEVKYPSHTPVPLPIGYKPIYCISQSALSWFLDGLERRQVDLLRFTSDKGPDLSTEGRNHLEASKPRSLEALSSRPLPVLLAANRTPSPCPCGSDAEAIHFVSNSLL